MKLRPYQEQAIEQIEGSFAFGSTEVCLDATVSFGKTITSSQFIKDQIEDGKSVVFMMNLTALVEQTMEALKSLSVPFKVIAAEFDGKEFDHQANVTIAMQQTLHARIGKIDVPKCDVLVVDEFHRSFETDTMKKVKQWLNPDIILGLSGTPYDEKGYALPGVDVVQTASTKYLTEQGYLTTMKVLSVKFAEDIDLSVSGSGEYSENFLDGILNNDEYNSAVVNAWMKVASDRKTIVFSTGIEHSIALAKMWKANGIKAEAYHSKLSKKDSKRIMDDFRNNRIQVLASVNKVLVGFDMPDITCVVACRPSRTRRVVIQGMGRLIRLFEGKTDALLLDCAQWTTEHGFIDEPYSPPKKGDKDALKKEKAKFSTHVIPAVLNEEEPTEITRVKLKAKIKELDRKGKDLKSLTFPDLLAIFGTSMVPIQLIAIASEIQNRKSGKRITPTKIAQIATEWDKMLSDYPEYETRLIRSLRTRSKDIVSKNQGLFRLGPDNTAKDGTFYKSFVNWLRTQEPYMYKYTDVAFDECLLSIT